MSKVVVELLEAAYPALNHTYMMLLRLSNEKARASSSMASNVESIMGDFSTAMDQLIGEAQLELGTLQPPHSNTGATLSQKTAKTPKLRGV